MFCRYVPRYPHIVLFSPLRAQSLKEMETGKAKTYDISELLRRYPVLSPISSYQMVEKVVCMTSIVEGTLIFTYNRADREDKIDLPHPALECAPIMSIIESYIPITFFSSLSVWKRSAITVPEIWTVLADMSWHLETFKKVHGILHGCVNVLLMSGSSMPDCDNLDIGGGGETDAILCMAINGGNVECLKYAFGALHLPLSLGDFVKGDFKESDWRREMILRGWRSFPGIYPSLVIRYISPKTFSLAYPKGEGLDEARYGNLLREAITQGSKEYILHLRDVIHNISWMALSSVAMKLVVDEKQIVETCNKCLSKVKIQNTLKTQVALVYTIVTKYADEKMDEFTSGWDSLGKPGRSSFSLEKYKDLPNGRSSSFSFPTLVMGDQNDKKRRALKCVTRTGGYNMIGEVLYFVRTMILDESREYGDLFFRKLIRESLEKIALRRERLPLDTYRFLVTHSMLSWKMILTICSGENRHHLIDTVIFMNGEKVIEEIYNGIINKVKKNRTDLQLSIPEEIAPYIFEIYKAMRKYAVQAHGNAYYIFSYPAIYRVLCRIKGEKYEHEIRTLKKKIEEMYRSECLTLGEDCGHHIMCGILRKCDGGKVLEEEGEE